MGAPRPPSTLSFRTRWEDQDWDAQVAAGSEGTFFHTRTWARIVLASFPRLQDRSVWLTSEGGEALLPLFAWRRAGGLLTTLHSTFPFLYGGLVPVSPMGAAPPRLPEILPRLLPALGAARASARLAGTPFAPAATPEACGGGFRHMQESTHLLALPASEEEYWEKTLSTGKRNDVRRLGKRGVEVVESRDPEQVAGFHRLYLASFEHWGGRPAMVYPLAFYRNLLLLGGEAVRLSLALREGRLLGGAFTIRWGGKVHYLAGYFDRESRADRPHVLIQIDSILRAIREGHRIYDFLPSGGHASVESFKEGLGGVRTPYPVFVRRGPVHRLLGRPVS